MDDELKRVIASVVGDVIKTEVTKIAEGLKVHIDARFYALNERLFDLETRISRIEQYLDLDRKSKAGNGHS